MADCAGIALGKRYTWQEIEKTSSSQWTKDLINANAKEKKADVCVVGFHGKRKGDNYDPTVMGSAVQYMAVNSQVPVFIIKEAIKRTEKKDGVYKFCACIDGSEKSMRAINYII